MSAPRNRTHLRTPLFLASLLLPLAGCSVYHAQAGGGFSDESLTAAGSASGIPFQVDGKVGGTQGAPLAAAVATAMPTSVGKATVHYTACEPYTECAGDHLVWTFGPPAARPAAAYPPAAAYNLHWFGGYEPAANNVTVKVALFQGGNVVASASGQTNADSPNDPAFQSLIAEMSASVLSGPDVLDWVGFP
jgi:hypothetical protein